MKSDLRDWRFLIETLLTHFDLDVVAVTPVGFTNNAVFRLHTAGGDYALRIHRPGYRTPRQTRSELTYLEAMAASRAPAVPQPIRTATGDLVARIETDRKGRHGSVQAWLQGEVRRPGRGAGPKTLFRIGRALGRIHEFSSSFQAPTGFELPTWDPETMFGDSHLEMLDTTKRQMVDEVRGRVAATFEKLERSSGTFGVLHNDFILLNCLHHRRRTAVIDFDDCGWGFYLQDLGGLLENLKDYPNYRALRRPFLDGYRSVRPLPSEREEDFEVMIALRHCTSTFWLLDRRQEGTIDPDRFHNVLTYRIEGIESSLRTLGG